MDALFELQPDLYQTPARVARDEPQPAMGWHEALATGRAHAQALAREKGFAVLGEDILNYDPHKGIFRLRLRTDRDRNTEWGLSPLFFDARTGELIGITLPTGEAAGDTITHWLQNLHTGHVWGLPYRVLLTVSGLVVVVLSVTGVFIWWRKRASRKMLRPCRPRVPSFATEPKS
ncbi:PepSY domain-containing protein [Hydrogenophaga intermedia]|uniref:PepSY domain-containing protein n=1 Tax=Hydrogenophaga intermedia TaxID=65786 RepID=UPI00204350ED|nr:PepSY domain-containing protein [Hydrogenophaga intermedia]MCM3566242.1 PepSY domain-containing protein [Hydrogenophaga intermedia]